MGDKLNPQQPPAIKSKNDPVVSQSIVDKKSILSDTVNTVRTAVRDTVSLANQASSALRLANDAVRVAKNLANNPVAALGQVSTLLTSTGQIAGPLTKMAPALASITDELPAAATILRASSNALTAVRNGQASLNSSNLGSVTNSISYLSGQLDVAGTALQSAAPSLAKLTSQIATRKM